MKDFAKNLAALIKVKTIVTLVVIVIFAVLALRGTIGEESVMYIVTSVISFYFGTQLDKKSGTNTEQSTDAHGSFCPLMMGDTEENSTPTEPTENEVRGGDENGENI